jgi:hypothetical protein
MGSIFLRGDSWVGEYKGRGKIRRVTFGRKNIITKTMAKEATEILANFSKRVTDKFTDIDGEK